MRVIKILVFFLLINTQYAVANPNEYSFNRNSSVKELKQKLYKVQSDIYHIEGEIKQAEYEIEGLKKIDEQFNVYRTNITRKRSEALSKIFKEAHMPISGDKLVKQLQSYDGYAALSQQLPPENKYNSFTKFGIQLIKGLEGMYADYNSKIAEVCSKAASKINKEKTDATSEINDENTKANEKAPIDTCRNEFEKLLKQTTQLDKIKTELGGYLLQARNKMELDIKELANLKITEQTIKEAITYNESLTNKIVSITIPAIGLVLLLISVVGPRFYSDAVQISIIENKLFLEILTVYILVSTILILGLTDRVDSEVLGTILGGISGYVLGRTSNARQSDKREFRRGDQDQATNHRQDDKPPAQPNQ